jgi:uncharacterized protein
MPIEDLFASASLPAKAAHGAIRFYQLTLSSVFGRGCRYLPSCSSYMDEAMLRHGFYKGGFMGFARLCRCNPLFEGGIDNVPVCLPSNATVLTPWRFGKWK